MTMHALAPIFSAAEGAGLPGYLSGYWLAVVMLVPPLVVWGAWAVVRARGEDTTRPQRTARRALRRLLAEWTSRGGTPTTRELEAWRREVIRLWKIEAAAPGPHDVAAQGGEALSRLWQEAEEALYARHGRLPEDWAVRAAQAVGAVAVPSAPWPWPRKHRHWLPVMVAVAGLALGGKKADAAEPPARAAAHGTSAYLLHPRDATVQASVRQSLGQVDSADPGLVRLLEGAWYDRAVGKISPAEWEQLARLAAPAAGLGFTLTVMLLYRGRTPRHRRVAFGVALLAGGVACTAFFGLRRYGPLADARAAFVVAPTEVKTIPSELGARQAVTNLAPGMIVVVDKSFLGWDHIIVREGVVGWIRTEQAVWLYRRRDDSRVSAEYAVR